MKVLPEDAWTPLSLSFSPAGVLYPALFFFVGSRLAYCNVNLRNIVGHHSGCYTNARPRVASTVEAESSPLICLGKDGQGGLSAAVSAGQKTAGPNRAESGITSLLA